jgi:hypothetical protein
MGKKSGFVFFVHTTMIAELYALYWSRCFKVSVLFCLDWFCVFAVLSFYVKYSLIDFGNLASDFFCFT